MFGRNEVTTRFVDYKGNLLVNEIYYTIQGEGPDAGRPAIFVRLSKCNLRCYFCDTEFESGKPMSVDDIMSGIKNSSLKDCDLVVITGGEPLLQNVAPLVRALNMRNVEVSVETAGTTWTDHYFGSVFQQGNKIVCSPKTAGLRRDIVPYVRAWKYIVSCDNVGDDGLPVRSTQIPGQAQRLFRAPKDHPAPVYIQPMDEQDPVKNKANMSLARDLCMAHGYRLSLQIHKLIGLP